MTVLWLLVRGGSVKQGAGEVGCQINHDCPLYGLYFAKILPLIFLFVCSSASAQVFHISGGDLTMPVLPRTLHRGLC